MSEIELHRKLLGDRLRNQAFHAALKKIIQPGKSTVVDVGAGTGFLSFLARQLGARHCTLIEYSGALELAQQLARKNKITDLTFIQAHSAEVKLASKADIVISETLGNYALEENLLETLVDARRFLNKNGVMIPGRLKQFAAPVIGGRLMSELDIWPQVGFGLDLTAARVLSLNNMYVKAIQPVDLMDSVQCWDDLNFSPGVTAPSSQRSHDLKWPMNVAQTVYGFAVWWECELAPGISISTSPFAPPTHWEQIYLPLLNALELQAGDTLEATLGSDTRPQSGVRVSWRTRHLRGRNVLSEQIQSTARGLL